MDRTEFVAYRRYVIWTLSWSIGLVILAGLLGMFLRVPYFFLCVGLAFYGVMRATFLWFEVLLKIGSLVAQRVSRS